MYCWLVCSWSSYCILYCSVSAGMDWGFCLCLPPFSLSYSAPLPHYDSLSLPSTFSLSSLLCPSMSLPLSLCTSLSPSLFSLPPYLTPSLFLPVHWVAVKSHCDVKQSRRERRRGTVRESGFSALDFVTSSLFSSTKLFGDFIFPFSDSGSGSLFWRFMNALCRKLWSHRSSASCSSSCFSTLLCSVSPPSQWTEEMFLSWRKPPRCLPTASRCRSRDKVLRSCPEGAHCGRPWRAAAAGREEVEAKGVLCWWRPGFREEHRGVSPCREDWSMENRWSSLRYRTFLHHSHWV